MCDCYNKNMGIEVLKACYECEAKKRLLPVKPIVGGEFYFCPSCKEKGEDRLVNKNDVCCDKCYQVLKWD